MDNLTVRGCSHKNSEKDTNEIDNKIKMNLDINKKSKNEMIARLNIERINMMFKEEREEYYLENRRIDNTSNITKKKILDVMRPRVMMPGASKNVKFYRNKKENTSYSSDIFLKIPNQSKEIRLSGSYKSFNNHNISVGLKPDINDYNKSNHYSECVLDDNEVDGEVKLHHISEIIQACNDNINLNSYSCEDNNYKFIDHC